jgi:hypothetical protein
MRPDLNRWQRAQIHAARYSLGAAAALLLLVIRAGTLMGFEKTRTLGEQFVDIQWRHIDPDGKSFGPRNLA